MLENFKKNRLILILTLLVIIFIFWSAYITSQNSSLRSYIANQEYNGNQSEATNLEIDELENFNKYCNINYSLTSGTAFQQEVEFFVNHEKVEVIDELGEVFQITPHNRNKNSSDLPLISMECVDPITNDGFTNQLQSLNVENIENIPFFSDQARDLVLEVRKETLDRNGIIDYYYITNRDNTMYKYAVGNRSYWARYSLFFGINN